MAATRKLQGEIDRCLKKVTEGVETFEDIWQKVHNATNSNQKEKYEADLKKEIKKLQRLRDQIKSWIASGEIKDKSTLLEYRKLIETQMERFKVVERETKTKAYSKEGLGAAQKLDPAQKERDEVSSWLVSCIDALNLQVDQFESEVESLLVGKKKRLDKEKQDRMEDLKSKLEKHRFHIKKLETLLRMLDNMSVEVDQIKNIKDDVEYYIDSSQEPDFEDNECIYDDIRGLDEVELSGVGMHSSGDESNSNDSPTSMLSGQLSATPVTSPTHEMHNHSTDSIDIEKKKKEEIIIAKPVKPLPIRAVNNSVPTVTNSSTNATPLFNNSAPPTNSITNNSGAATPVTVLSRQQPAPSPIPHLVPRQNNNIEVLENGPIGGATHNSHLPVHPQPPAPRPTTPAALPVTAPPPAPPLPVTLNGPPHPAPHNNPHPPSHNPHPSPHNPHNPHPPPHNPHPPHPSHPAHPAHTASLHPAPPPHSQHNNTNSMRMDTPVNVMSSGVSNSNESASSLKSIAQEAVQRAGLDTRPPQVGSTESGGGGTGTAGTGARAHIPPLLGVAPLGPAPLSQENQLQLSMMESSFYHMPHPSDSERSRPYLPRNICQTPLYYNQVLLPHSDSVEFFQRLSTETLFFVFYYMEGSKAQYLAAKALKKQSWRFHTKYMMWFQRHEEPKLINEEYEQGTYIYFDYEKWGQRKKEGFTFEYKYLEDRDLN